MEGAWGKADDLGQDREEGTQTGPLGLPALQDFEDALAHTADLRSVTLQVKHRWGPREGLTHPSA